MASPSENITFRLKSDLLRKLDQQRDPFGDSRGEYARRLVIAELDGSKNESLLNQLTELRQMVAGIEDDLGDNKDTVRDALRRLTFVLLTANDGMSATEAKQIARRVAGTAGE